jgi:hypothetical protein
MRDHARALTGWLFAAVPLAAQATWNVPNFADLAPFIAQAAPGDTLVLGNAHPGFTLTKGLTLRPATGRTTITAISAPLGMSSAIQLPAGQSAILQALDFTASGQTPWWSGGHEVVVDGVVSFEDCTFQSRAGPNFVVQANGGAVAFQRCTLQGLSNCTPLRVVNGTCSAVDCTFLGAPGVASFGTNPNYPTPGVVVLGGTFHASHSTFTPGASTIDPNGFPIGPAAGLQVQGGVASTSDCTIAGADYPLGASVPPPWTGAAAIRALGGMARHARCTLLPGNGSPPGSPTEGNAVADDELVGMHTTIPLRIGSTWTMTAVAGTSGQPLAFAFWPALAPTTLPEVNGLVWGDPGQAVLLGLAVPAPGSAVPVALWIPNVSSLVGASLWAQAVQLTATTIQASPVVGGVVY